MILPADNLSCLSITTTNGDMTLSALSLSQGVSLNVNNGNIDFDLLEVGKTADFTVKNGDLNGALYGGRDDYSKTASARKEKSPCLSKNLAAPKKY